VNRALYHHRTQGRAVEAVHILGIVRGLEKAGYEVEIVGPPGVRVEDRAAESTGGESVAAKGTSPWRQVARRCPQALFELLEIGYNLSAFPRLWWRCRQQRPALIYERYALFNAAGVLAGRLTGTPIILEVNDTVDVERVRQGKKLRMRGLARRFERWIFRGATGLVCVSGFLRDQVAAAGVPPERIRVTPNAVDLVEFDLSRAEAARVRERLALGEGPVVGFVGSFAPWHRVDLLVDAFAALAGEFPGARLLLVGDGLCRREVEQRVEALGLRERVTFTGQVAHAEVAGFVAAMDVAVMPESNEFGSPMKVLEYLALSRATIGPEYGPLREILTHGENGLLFPPRDAAALAGCLRTLLSDPELRARLGKRGREGVESRHQWAHNVDIALSLTGRAVAEPASELERNAG
jgi:glycosyltransferase involved in cell wall biosynthesis